MPDSVNFCKFDSNQFIKCSIQKLYYKKHNTCTLGTLLSLKISYFGFPCKRSLMQCSAYSTSDMRY